MCRSRSFLFSIAITAASSLLVSCSAERHAQNALLGYWINDAGEADTLEFFPDGSLVIAGLRKTERIRGSYRFLDDDNIEMNLRFEPRNEWRPTWMPPGVRRDPVLRARLSFPGDTLEFRPRGQIKADNIEQFIEFGTLKFHRAPPPDEAPNPEVPLAHARGRFQPFQPPRTPAPPAEAANRHPG